MAQETEPDLPVSVQESSWWRHGSKWPVAGSGALTTTVMCKSFRRRFITIPWFGLRPNNRERTQPHPSTGN